MPRPSFGAADNEDQPLPEPFRFETYVQPDRNRISVCVVGILLTSMLMAAYVWLTRYWPSATALGASCFIFLGTLLFSGIVLILGRGALLSNLHHESYSVFRKTYFRILTTVYVTSSVCLFFFFNTDEWWLRGGYSSALSLASSVIYLLWRTR